VFKGPAVEILKTEGGDPVRCGDLGEGGAVDALGGGIEQPDHAGFVGHDDAVGAVRDHQAQAVLAVGQALIDQTEGGDVAAGAPRPAQVAVDEFADQAVEEPTRLAVGSAFDRFGIDQAVAGGDERGEEPLVARVVAQQQLGQRQAEEIVGRGKPIHRGHRRIGLGDPPVAPEPGDLLGRRQRHRAWLDEFDAPHRFVGVLDQPAEAVVAPAAESDQVAAAPGEQRRLARPSEVVAGFVIRKSRKSRKRGQRAVVAHHQDRRISRPRAGTQVGDARGAVGGSGKHHEIGGEHRVAIDDGADRRQRRGKGSDQ